MTLPATRLAEALRRHPIIAGVRQESDLQVALDSPVQVLFLLATSLSRLRDVGSLVANSGKLLFIHLDFVEGLGRDEAGLEFLLRTTHPTGVITTRTGLVHIARRAGILGVQRLFCLDSQSLGTGLEAARSGKVEVLEVLPGILPDVIGTIRRRLPNTLITAGGLVTSLEQARSVLAAGAAGVSTSHQPLWHLEPAAFRNAARSS